MDDAQIKKARRNLVSGLTLDLSAAGWDQSCKLYFAIGEPGDEYLEFIGDIDMDPEHWLMHRADEGTLNDRVCGIAVMYEAWVFPKALNKALEQSEQVCRAYRTLVSPHDHPERAELRTVTMVMRDGYVARTEHYTDNPEHVRVKEMDGRPKDGIPIGKLDIDCMRSLLGSISLPDVRQFHSIGQAIAARPALQEIVKRGEEQRWPSERMSAEIFLGMEPAIQFDMLDTMPEIVHEYLVNLGFDFDALMPPNFVTVDV